jgi:hypothetical protein
LPARGGRTSQRKRLERLGGDPVLRAGAIVQVVRRPGGKADWPLLAVAHRPGLHSVLAKRREVDHQVGRVEQPLSYVNQLSH